MPSCRLAAGVFLLSACAGQAKDPLPMEKHEFEDARGQKLPYRLLKPLVVEKGKRYPLVVFLHGAGERGTDNEKQLIHGVPQFATEENRKKYPCFLIAPQCPEGKRWVEVDWGADSHKLPKEPSEPARLTLELIHRSMKELPIDPDRVYVTGLSMGGYGTWDLVARRPDLFAAAAPVCGGADEATAATIKHVPVWVFHGAKDTAVKPARSRNMVAALEKAGGKPKYTEYPDVGHNSWDNAYRDPEFYKWLFAQRQPAGR
jgi:predicted peptidase